MKKILLFTTFFYVFGTHSLFAQKTSLVSSQRKETLLIPFKVLYSHLTVCLQDKRLMPIHPYIQRYLEHSFEIQTKIEYLAGLDSIPNFDIAMILSMDGITADSVVKKSQDKLYDHMTFMKYDLIACRIPSQDSFFDFPKLITSFKHVMDELGNPMSDSEANSILTKTIPYDALFAFISTGSENIMPVENNELYILNRVLRSLYDSYKKDAIIIQYDFVNMILAGQRVQNIVALSDFIQRIKTQPNLYKKNLLPMIPSANPDGLGDVITISTILGIQPDVYQFHLYK